MKGRIIAVVIGFCSSLLFLDAVLAEESNVKLKEVVVTATKTEKEPQDVTQSVTVITADEIKKSGATTAAQVVERTVGLKVHNYGSDGALNYLSMRGSTAAQVLVLVDGRRMNSATSGGFDLSVLPVSLESIERIEIVRGPSSALYGADAVGGVVHIITKKPTGLDSTVTRIEGNHGYEYLSAATAHKLGKFYYAVSAGKEKYDGFRINSDLDKTTVGAKLGYDISPNTSMEIKADYLEREVGVPGPKTYPTPLAREWDRNASAGFAVKTKLTKDLDIRMASNAHRDKLLYKNPDPFFPEDSRHIISGLDGEVQANWLVASWNLFTAGAEVRADHLDSRDSGEHSTSLRAIYLQDEISIGDSFIFVVGGRYDNHSVYGDKFSPRASARYLIARTGTIVRVSGGRAFRAPTFNELYWPITPYAYGNPYLKPEISREFEGGIEQALGKGNSIKFTAFERHSKELIVWQPDSSYAYHPMNFGSARITGYEIESKFTVMDAVVWGMNYTYMNPVDQDGGDYIIGIPADQVKGYLNITIPWTKTNVYIEGRYVRNYYLRNIPAASNPSPHYTVVDAKILQPVSLGPYVKADLFAGVRNMCNRHYEVLANYPMPPREFYAGLTVRF